MNNTIDPQIKKFFDEYQSNINTGNPETATLQYGDPIMIATPKGAYTFTNEEFLKLLPGRKQFFETTGLKSTKVISLEEISSDQTYFIIKAIWKFHFEKNPSKPSDIEVGTTYILRKEDETIRIIFQLDHEDLMEKLKANS